MLSSSKFYESAQFSQSTTTNRSKKVTTLGIAFLLAILLLVEFSAIILARPSVARSQPSH